MNHKRAFILVTLLCTVFAAQLAIARPPETLDLNFLKYKKTSEGLFSEPVRHVLIIEDELRPYALIFDNKIVFLNKKGKTISESEIPLARIVRVGESKTGKYVALYGNLLDSNLGFFRLFNEKGKLLLSRDSLLYNDRRAVPLPLERSKRLVSIDNGVISLTTFKGETLKTYDLFKDGNYLNGDIFMALRGSKDEFSVIANKAQIPSGKDEDRPALYLFDGKLNLQMEERLPYLLISTLEYTPDGKYFQINVEPDTGKSKLIVRRTYPDSLDKPLVLEDVSIIRLAVRNPEKSPGGKQKANMAPVDAKSIPIYKRDLALIIPERGVPSMKASPDWNTLGSIYLQPLGFPVVDADLNSDGRYALFFNSAEIILWEGSENKFGRTEFSFSFSRCFISDNSGRILLAGDFGYVVYDKAK